MKEDGREAWTAEMLACDLERTIGRIPPGKLSCYLSSLLAACREQGRIDPRVFSRCEEENADDRRDAEWVFILDPIDGTDVYSQGMPSFAVSPLWKRWERSA